MSAIALSPPNGRHVVVIGAGPAGLTAALGLVRRGVRTTVLEADDVVGGISRTVERDGWRFDIGGHRFFTKVPEVNAMWRDLLDGDDLLVRPRMSRIFYGGKFYDYPLKASSALKNLGPIEAARCVASYAWARVHPPADTSTFEGWVASRFGWRLYNMFFKTYTEKVWGVPASSIQADWAAQRIKNLSLGGAIVNALRPRRNQTKITSLIEQFLYPKYGPGMMWEACHDRVIDAGGDVRLQAPVTSIERNGDRAVRVHAAGSPDGWHCDSVVSTMPIGKLVESVTPAAPSDVLQAARGLKHRDFLTVALVVPEHAAFEDNWIYVHSPEVRLGRVQNFGAWSPWMVKPGYTCLGLEYFVNEGDELWSMSDGDLIAFATDELERIGLVASGVVEQGFAVRVPKAYPVYDADYADRVDRLRGWLASDVTNVHPVGRNGMHRYNNQDHSMYAAMLTVENIVDGAAHDVWTVNVEQEYQEEQRPAPGSSVPATGSIGTGRAAPVIG